MLAVIMRKWILQLFFVPLFFASHYDVLIVGGGPAGLTAGVYASRMGMKTFVAEGAVPGGQLTTTHLVENFPGFIEGIQGPDLIANMRKQAVRYGATIETKNATALQKNDSGYTLTLSSGETVSGKALIVATGSSPKLLGLPSESVLFGKGVSTCAVCDAPFYKGADVIVVGGGDSAFEEALLLAKFAKNVTIIHRTDRFRASSILQERVKATKNIAIRTWTTVKEVLDPTKDEVTAVIVKGPHGEEKIACDGLFIAIGQTPNTQWLQESVELGPSGQIASCPKGVFPAGDVTDTRYRQAITAAGSGCKAALDAYEYIQSQGGNR